MRGEVVGLNIPKIIKENTSGIAFALSESDLLDVLHRFYPTTAPIPLAGSGSRSSVSKTEETSAGRDIPPGKSATVVLTGTVRFEGTAGAEIYVDGNFVGHIPTAIPRPEGRHEILIRDGKSADRQKQLTVLAGSSQTPCGISDRTIKLWRLSRSPSRQHHSNALVPARSRIRRAATRLIEERLTRTDELLGLQLINRQSAELRSLQHRFDLRSQCITLSSP